MNILEPSRKSLAFHNGRLLVYYLMAIASSNTAAFVSGTPFILFYHT